MRPRAFAIVGLVLSAVTLSGCVYGPGYGYGAPYGYGYGYGVPSVVVAPVPLFFGGGYYRGYR